MGSCEGVPVEFDASAPLRSSLGATPVQLEDGSEVVAHFGSVEAEYRALVEGAGIVIRNWPDHLRVQGVDRAAFLNGKVTCDIDGLERGEGAYGFILDAKGHIQADAVVRVLDSAIWLELPAGRGPQIAEHLQRFVVIDRVEFESLDAVVPLTLIGPRARDVLTSGGASVPPPDRPWQLALPATDSDGEVLVSADGRWGHEAFTLWPSARGAAGCLGALLESGRDFGARLVGFEALDRVRIEAGIPWFGPDFGEANLPQETGQHEAVSYTKGCYLGQEVVARLHYRGQVQQVVCQLAIEADEVPTRGTSLTFEGRQMGTLTSVARSLRLGCIVGLAMLRRGAAGLGSRLEVASGGHARVSKTPLESRA